MKQESIGAVSLLDVYLLRKHDHLKRAHGFNVVLALSVYKGTGI